MLDDSILTFYFCVYKWVWKAGVWTILSGSIKAVDTFNSWKKKKLCMNNVIDQSKIVHCVKCFVTQNHPFCRFALCLISNCANIAYLGNKPNTLLEKSLLWIKPFCLRMKRALNSIYSQQKRLFIIIIITRVQSFCSMVYHLNPSALTLFSILSKWNEF